MTKASPVAQEDVEQHRQELLRKHEPAIRPFLQPGEAVRAIVMADIDSTVKKPPLRYLPKEGQIDQWIERSNRGVIVNTCGSRSFRRLPGPPFQLRQVTGLRVARRACR